jgi:hypothetical protein
MNRIAFLASLATAAPLLGCGMPDEPPRQGWFVRFMGVLVLALAAVMLRHPNR